MGLVQHILKIFFKIWMRAAILENIYLLALASASCLGRVLFCPPYL